MTSSLAQTVSENMWLGTMQFGGSSSDSEAREIFDLFTQAGGKLIDTADTYNGGESEKLCGQFLEGVRDNYYLATKVGNPVDGVPNSGGLTKSWIEDAVKQSCDRLRTDHIDLYYLHLEREETPLEETLEAIGELLEHGTIREWGFSNFKAWKVAEIIRLCDNYKIARPTWAQPYYHLLNRTEEANFLPACKHFGIKTVTYSPLARGVLTGKYSSGAKPEGSRADRGDERILETDFQPFAIAQAEKASAYAEKRGKSLPSLAVQWVLANKLVDTVLVGPRTAEQMQSYLDAFDCPYDGEDEIFLSSLCNPGQFTTPGHYDRRYPLVGRQTAFD